MESSHAWARQTVGLEVVEMSVLGFIFIKETVLSGEFQQKADNYLQKSNERHLNKERKLRGLIQ